MNNVNIRVLQEDDWQLYKLLRLSALQESPDSFGSTYEREFGFPDDEWISRLRKRCGSRNALPLVAEVGGNPSGLALGQVHDQHSRTAYVYQMWVAPEARGMRMGRALLDHIIAWAEKTGLVNVELAVTTTNSAAIALYQSSGFEAYGELEELRPGSAISVQLMILKLRTRAG